MTFYLSFFMIFFFSCLKLKSSWMQSLEKNLFWLSCQSSEKSHFHCVVTALLYVCISLDLLNSSRCLTLQSETKLQQNWNSFAFYSFVLFCLKLEPSWNAIFKKCVGCLVRALRSDAFGVVGALVYVCIPLLFSGIFPLLLCCGCFAKCLISCTRKFAVGDPSPKVLWVWFLISSISIWDLPHGSSSDCATSFFFWSRVLEYCWVYSLGLL